MRTDSLLAVFLLWTPIAMSCAACGAPDALDGHDMSEPSPPQDMSTQDMNARERDLLDTPDSNPSEPDLARPVDLGEPDDLGDPGDLSADMLDAGPPAREIIARFDKTRSQSSPFPWLTNHDRDTSSPDATIDLSGQLMLDAELSDTNGYPFADLQMPTYVPVCSRYVEVRDVTFDASETVYGDGDDQAIYARAARMDDLLRVTVRGVGEITLPLTGRLSFDAEDLPEGCAFQGMEGSEVPFSLELHIKSAWLQIEHRISRKQCHLLDQWPHTASNAIREGMTLDHVMDVSLEYLDVQDPSPDSARWPFPSNVDPAQPGPISVVGPEMLDVSAEDRIRAWPIPYTPHGLEIADGFSFDVSPKSDAFTSVTPLFFVPALAGGPVYLESGGSYDNWRIHSNVIIAYVPMMNTDRGHRVCAEHFPDTAHPDLSIVASTSTPEVCDVEEVPDDYDFITSPHAVDRWFVAGQMARIKKDGLCEMSYSYYLDGATTPFHVEKFEVELLDTHELGSPEESEHL